MVVDEFRRSVMREVDFVTEASYTSKIKEELAGDPRVCVPAVYWDLTTSDVLTLERIAGVSLTKKAELAALNIDRKRLARDLVEIFLHQFFKAGLFHADPHSGNILITPDGRIGLVDFGMAGRLSEELRAHLATSFIALTKKDVDVIADMYMEIGVVSPDTRRRSSQTRPAGGAGPVLRNSDPLPGRAALHERRAAASRATITSCCRATSCCWANRS